MKTKEIIKNTAHRPWKMPSKKWLFYQEWNDVIFLHWKIDVNFLKKFVPDDLEIDLIENEAWVSIVPFTMQNVRFRNLPSFKPISDFHEVNIRTYVKYNNHAGVYFLSIEAGKAISAFLARNSSYLPYRYSRMKRTHSSFEVRNEKQNDFLSIEFEIDELVGVKNEHDLWLSERYTLFQDHDNQIHEYEVHHIEWPIHQINDGE